MPAHENDPEPSPEARQETADSRCLTNEELEQLALESMAGLGVVAQEEARKPLNAESEVTAQNRVGTEIADYRLIHCQAIRPGRTSYIAVSGQEPSQEFRIEFIHSLPADTLKIAVQLETEIRLQTRLAGPSGEARLIATGTVEPGILYVVAHRFPGMPIDEYAGSRRLELAARMRLCQAACAAVDQAHRNGIIHGELYPHNILVDDEGAVAIIDYGLGRSLPASVRSVTEYTSPEELESREVVTTTDVYALGILLYRLATDRSPYQILRSNHTDLEQAIYEQVPELPSRAVQSTTEDAANPGTSAPQPVSETIPADLDAVISKAISRELAARYASAGQLGEDLRRWLDGAPVVARSDSLLYLLGRAMRRHPRRVAMISLLVTAFLLTGVTAGLVELLKNRFPHRNPFHTASAEAYQLAETVFQQLDEDLSVQQPELDSFRKTLLQESRNYLLAYIREHEADPTRSLEIAKAYVNLGVIDRLTDRLEESQTFLVGGVTRWNDLAQEKPDDRQIAMSLASAFFELAQTAMALEIDTSQVIASLKQAAEILKTILDTQPSSSELRIRLARVQITQSQLLAMEKNTSLAIEALNSVIDTLSPGIAENETSIPREAILGEAYLMKARLLQNDPTNASNCAQHFQKTIHTLTPLVEKNPERIRLTDLLAQAWQGLAVLQEQHRQPQDARASLERSIALFDSLQNAHPQFNGAQIRLIDADLLLTQWLLRDRQYSDALAVCRKALPLSEALAKSPTKNANDQIRLARCLSLAGRALKQSGDQKQALDTLHRAIDILESLADLKDESAYELARDFALSLPLLEAVKPAQDSTLSKLTRANQVRRKQYSDRAMELLKRIGESGYLSSESLQNETDLDSLRDRDDFQNLLRKLEDAPAHPPKTGAMPARSPWSVGNGLSFILAASSTRC